MKHFHVEDLQDDIQLDPFKCNKSDPIGVFNLGSHIPIHIKQIMEENTNESEPFVLVTFSDGDTKKMYYKHLIFNIIVWRIYAALRLPINKDDVFVFKNINEKYLSKLHTIMLPKCLTIQIDKRIIFGLFHESVTIFNNFAHCYTWEYASGISLMEMYDILDLPGVQEICELNIDNAYDTRVVEIEIERKKKELVDIIKTSYQDCCIGPYLLTDTLNLNQIAQLFIAYGPRSDVNDDIVGKAILRGTLLGLDDIEQLAVESLASKKSAIYNRSSVGIASYNNKQGLLTSCEIYHAIEIPCCNDETLRTYISEGNRFLGKSIIEDGKEFKLTEQNIHKYDKKYVDMVSVIHCRQVNGICSRCMGDMFNFYVTDLHLGLASGSEIFSVILQLILSSKHLIKTDTIPFLLNEICNRLFVRNNNDFALKRFDPKYKLGIPTSAIGNFMAFNDITKIKEDEFSKIRSLVLLDENDEVVELLEVGQEPVYPYFSRQFLNFLIHSKQDIVLKDHVFIVPMAKWKFESNFFKIPNITFDMTTYVNSVWTFMRKDLKRYTSVSEALNDFAAIVYKKSTANIMLIEIILRSLMIASPTDFSFPVRKSGDPIYFGTLLNVIANRSLTPKLVFERLSHKTMQQDYFLQELTTYTKPNSIGLFAPFFGL